MAKTITNFFPLLAVLFSFVAYYEPALFKDFKGSIVILLGIVMLGMGMTLTREDFTRVLKRPKAVVLGVSFQYLLMPVLAWGIAIAAGLAPELAVGLVLVGCCPGGTASNVICYLARGDTALSITLTTTSTFLAVFMTPLLTYYFVGQAVAVDWPGMLWSIMKIVIVPVSLGVFINGRLGNRLRHVRSAFPVISVFSICFIIAIIVSINRDNLNSAIGIVLFCVFIHNTLGFACGYGLAKLCRLTQKECRTISIEVGMQNSGLGVALAVQFFTAMTAVPGAVFSIWHNLAGSILAGIWSRRERVRG